MIAALANNSARLQRLSCEVIWPRRYAPKQSVVASSFASLGVSRNRQRDRSIKVASSASRLKEISWLWPVCVEWPLSERNTSARTSLPALQADHHSLGRLSRDLLSQAQLRP